jgi:hypothetical protein
MSRQVDRLQALLQRVEDNRKKPRAVAAFAPEAVPAPVAAPAPPAVRAPAAPVRSAAPAPEQRPKPKAPTPLEMAVEGRISQPAMPPPEAKPQLPPTRPRVAAVAPAPQGVLLVEGTLAEPSKPIAHVVSMHPPSTALTFGELLRRSLSLRPR